MNKFVLKYYQDLLHYHYSQGDIEDAENELLVAA